MNRNAAAVALLVTGVMVLSSLWAIPGSQGIPVSPPPLLPHQSAITIEKFTGMDMQNLSPAPGGGVRLGYGDRIWGGDFKVNPDGDHQKEPSVAAGQNGLFLVVWMDDRLGPSDQNVYAQVFDKRGKRSGDEIAVCTAQSNQESPDVAPGANGSFIVAWTDQRDPGAEQIYVKLLDGEGKTLKADAPVSTGPSFKAHPAIAGGPAGGFIVVWRDDRDSSAQIYGRLLDSSGKPSAGEFGISASLNSQDYPDVAADGAGRFLVVWSSQNTGVKSIDGQRFDSGGNKAGTALTIASGDYYLTNPKVAFDSGGNFITTWNDGRDFASNSMDIYAARYDQNGTAIGTQIAVAADPKSQERPKIAVDGRDNFLVCWLDRQEANGRIGSRLFGPPGEALGEVQYQSSSYINYMFPAGCVDREDNFMIVWAGYSSLAYHLYGRALLQTYKTQSSIITESYSPDKLVRWGTLSADLTLANSASNSATFELSTDGGATWNAVPDNGSLAAAEGKALKVRARLLTSDNLTTPILRSMTLSYTWNTPPSVAAPAEVKVKKGKEVTLASNGTDPDLQDALSLGYKWNQTSGKALGLTNITGRNLTFSADKAGRFTFSVVVSDSYASSPPASATVVVSEDKKDEAGIPLLAIIAVVIAVIIVVPLLAVMMMRKKSTTVIQYQPPPAASAPPMQPAPPPVQPPTSPPQQPPPAQ